MDFHPEMPPRAKPLAELVILEAGAERKLDSRERTRSVDGLLDSMYTRRDQGSECPSELKQKVEDREDGVANSEEFNGSRAAANSQTSGVLLAACCE